MIDHPAGVALFQRDHLQITPWTHPDSMGYNPTAWDVLGSEEFVVTGNRAVRMEMGLTVARQFTLRRRRMVFAVEPDGAIHLTEAEWDSAPMNQDESDPFDLNRFVSAQEGIYDTALAELRRGQKRSHWMWFIFPQLAGLGSSGTSRKYAIKSLAEAWSYLAHPVLGQRLLDCCQAILSVQGRSASEIMGYPDDLKLRSSMTLFALAGDSHPEFRQVIDRYFNGQPDPRTLELLRV